MGGTAVDATAEESAQEGQTCDVGETLAGRYRIVRFIARGSAGAVYEADDLIVGAAVAVKVLHAEHARSATAVERMHRELALARRITHRNVCRLHDVNEDRGRLFLTMELLDGETLAARIARGPVPLAEIEAIAEQLVAALEAAHAEGVVHRDFKPQNVLVVEDRVVVTDFGLARAVDDEGQAASLTGDTAMLGTPAYMAPEQVEGREATVASDVYALGVVLFELVTGQPPFREATALATATARLHRDPPPIVRAGLGAGWRAAIVRCLRRAPVERFGAARDVLVAARSRRRLRRGGVGLIALALAAPVAVVVGLGLRSDEPNAVPDHAFPTHVRPRATKAAVAFDRADQALVAGDRVQARSLLEVAAASEPDDAVAQAALAEVLDGLGYEERAREASKRAQRFRAELSGEPRAYVDAVDAIVRGDAAAVVAILQPQVVIVPDEPAYRLRLATALVTTAQPELALAAIDHASVPAIPRALASSAIAAARGDPRSSLAHAEEAARLAPPGTRPNDHAQALVLSAAARWRQGDPASAERDYARALELGDTGVAVLARAGLIDLDTTNDDISGVAARYREQADLVRTLGNREYLAELLMDGASLFAESGDMTTAEAMMAEARLHSVALANPVDIAWVDALEARLALWHGQLSRAATLAERGYRAGMALGRAGIAGNSYYTWSHVLLELDDTDGLAKLRALRTETIERLVDCVIAHREGDLDRAERIARALANRETYEGRIALVVIAQVALARGRLDEAERGLVDVAANMQGDTNSIVARERLEHAQASLLAKRGRLADALAQLDRQAERCARAALTTCEVHTLAVAAELATAGQAADAKRRTSTALARADALDMRRTARELRAIVVRQLGSDPVFVQRPASRPRAHDDLGEQR